MGLFFTRRGYSSVSPSGSCLPSASGFESGAASATGGEVDEDDDEMSAGYKVIRELSLGLT